MKKIRYILLALLTLVICLSWTNSSFASDIGNRDSRPTGEVYNSESEDSGVRPQWGTANYSVVSIPGIAFRHTYSDTTYAYHTMGSIYRTGGSHSYFDAPLYLPTGAQIVWVDLYYYDDNASADVSYHVMRYFGQEDGETLYTDTSSGTPGFGALLSSNIFHTVNNGDSQYVIYVTVPATDLSLRVRRVRVYYSLQISPAPSTATFTDVPVGSFWHQYVEALAASGITTGYGDGTFGPNDYVTRGQMAAFLSRALGLHWPY